MSAKTKAKSHSPAGKRASGSSNITADHDQIRRWVEKRGGTPACVRATGGRGDVGVLRIDFPDGEEENLQKISWHEWFDKFDERHLVFLYQNRTSSGAMSRFNKLVSTDRAELARLGKRQPAGRKTLTAGG